MALFYVELRLTSFHDRVAGLAYAFEHDGWPGVQIMFSHAILAAWGRMAAVDPNCNVSALSFVDVVSLSFDPRSPDASSTFKVMGKARVVGAETVEAANSYLQRLLHSTNLGPLGLYPGEVRVTSRPSALEQLSDIHEE